MEQKAVYIGPNEARQGEIVENIGHLRAAGCESLADMVDGSLRGEGEK